MRRGWDIGVIEDERGGGRRLWSDLRGAGGGGGGGEEGFFFIFSIFI